LREYQAICEKLTGVTGGREEVMRATIDVLWEALSPTGVSWIGFYTAKPSDDEMLLGPRRDKPACSPIGMHGACGQAFKDKSPLVVRNVASLGKGYVACDPKDVSELIIPVFEADGTPWGVLDADSFDEGSFDEHDAIALRSLLEQVGLSDPAHGKTLPRVV